MTRRQPHQDGSPGRAHKPIQLRHAPALHSVQEARWLSQKLKCFHMSTDRHMQIGASIMPSDRSSWAQINGVLLEGMQMAWLSALLLFTSAGQEWEERERETTNTLVKSIEGQPD